jgi:hypothetical protein
MPPDAAAVGVAKLDESVRSYPMADVRGKKHFLCGSERFV